MSITTATTCTLSTAPVTLSCTILTLSEAQLNEVNRHFNLNEVNNATSTSNLNEANNAASPT
jgi:hypothetical protein